MLSNISLRKKGLLLVLLPLAFEVLFILGIAFFVWEGDRQSQEADQAVAISQAANNLSQTLINTGFNLIVFGLSKSNKAQQDFTTGVQSIKLQQQEIKRLLQDNPRRLAAFSKTDEAFRQAIKILDEMKGSFDEGLSINTLNKISTDNRLRNETFKLIGDITANLTELARLGRADRNTLVKDLKSTELALRVLLVAGICLNVILAVVAALTYRSDLVLRLGTITENCNRIEEEKPLSAPLVGKDEVCDLDRTFHQMAAELKEVARRERAVVEDAVDVICTLGENGSFLSLNKAAEGMWGYSRQELRSKAATELLLAERRKAFEEFLQSCTEITARNADFSTVNSKGEIKETRWSVRRSHSAQTVYCVVSDVTTEKETERMKSHFVSMVTHDLRTPLNSMHNMLTMMESGLYGETGTGELRLAQECKSSCEGLIKLISDFLDLEKIESNSYTLDQRTVDISSLIDGLCDQLETQNRGQDAEITLIDATRGAQIYADATLIQSGLTDLLSSLLHRSPDGELTVSLSQSDSLSLAFKGFTGTDLTRAFDTPFRDLFASIDTVVEEHFEEMMRLARFKAIVSLHGGSIHFGLDEQSRYQLTVTLPTNFEPVKAEATA